MATIQKTIERIWIAEEQCGIPGEIEKPVIENRDL